MPLSFLLGIASPDPVPAFSWIQSLAPSASQPLLAPSRLVYIGLRDLDAGEKRLLKEHGIKAFSMHDVDKWGIGRVVDMALEHVNKEYTAKDGKPASRPLHLSFDVDALDPSVAPSTGTPVRGGLTFREGHYICEAIWETKALVALDLMVSDPDALACIFVWLCF